MTTARPDLVIRGGTVVTDSWSGAATVTVAGGRITGVLDPAAEVDGAEVLDATGLLVMPGGVDPHCHVAVPLGEFVTLDSFESASLAALAGGTTTIIDFAIPGTGEGPIGALRGEAGDGQGLPLRLRVPRVHQRPGPGHRGRGAALRRGGRAHGQAVHHLPRPADGRDRHHRAGDARAQRGVRADLRARRVQPARRGRAGRSRVARAASTPPGWPAPGRRRPRRVRCRRCSARPSAPARRSTSCTRRSRPPSTRSSPPGSAGCARSPSPARTTSPWTTAATPGSTRSATSAARRSADRAAVDELGDRLAMGYVHTVGSDHCCYDTGQKELRAHDVRAMPNGLPGVETRLSVVWDAYVASGRISPERFVAVMAANPARLNGLYPRKGAIAPGADADLVLFDPAATRVVRSGELHMQTDYTPYEGREVTGWPRTVLARRPGRGARRRAHRPRPGRPVPARGPHRPDVSDPGEATRRAVLGDEHVDRSDAAITPFSRPLTEYRTRAGWGEVWSRDGLDRRARSLVTLGVLVALRAHDELAVHVRGAVAERRSARGDRRGAAAHRRLRRDARRAGRTAGGRARPRRDREPARVTAATASWWAAGPRARRRRRSVARPGRRRCCRPRSCSSRPGRTRPR